MWWYSTLTLHHETRPWTCTDESMRYGLCLFSLSILLNTHRSKTNCINLKLNAVHCFVWLCAVREKFQESGFEGRPRGRLTLRRHVSIPFMVRLAEVSGQRSQNGKLTTIANDCNYTLFSCLLWLRSQLSRITFGYLCRNANEETAAAASADVSGEPYLAGSNSFNPKVN